MSRFRQLLFGVFTLSAIFAFNATCQPVISADDYLVNGFGRKISGDDYEYHSSVPDVTQSLIVRATDGFHTMEWESSEIPGKIKEKYVSFVWLSGLGSSPGKAMMNLLVDDQQMFSFSLDGKENWEMSHANGSELHFHSDLTDMHGDHFGFMFLRIPTHTLKKRKHIRIKVIGANHQLSSWYMTFRMEVLPGLKIAAYPALKVEHGSRMQQVGCGLVYLGEPAVATIYLDDKALGSRSVGFGYNHLVFGIPEVEKPEEHQLRIEADSFRKELDFVQEPVKKWRVNFVQHSHTDIGYTRSQTDILAEHMRFIDYALDYCDQTDDYPEASRFRWTCETTWAVNEYLKSRPKSQVERFAQRIREGRIELTGMYLNFDELPDEQSLAASLAPMERLKELDFPVRVAMQNDINGIAWCLNDFYQDLGVRYLNMGTHGHRALICFDKPTLFWWESPSGKRMLTFRAEHYMTGNRLELETGDLARFEMNMLNYLTDLEAKGYPYDHISIQFSGYRTDNSPPSTAACDMIRRWNALYDWPKIRTANTADFFEEMETRYAAEFPVYRGAWPDWWTDGFGASAREVATVRKAQSDLIANTGGLAMAAAMGNPLPENIDERIGLVNQALLFYTEHTVGYHGSVREPYHKESMEQRSMKESYAWEALRRSGMIREEALGLLQNRISNEADPSLVVYNTLNWERSGLLRLFIDHQIVQKNHSFVLEDESGELFPAQADSHIGGGSWWFVWVEDIPAFGYKKFRIRSIGEPATEELPASPDIENRWYRLEINDQEGAIASLWDKEMGMELIDQESEWDMGQFIYERLGNRHQMEQFRLDDYERTSLDSAWLEPGTNGPLWTSVCLKGLTEASIRGHELDLEIRLFKPAKRVDMVYSIVKKPVIEPEGIYIAFPFTLDKGSLYFDVQGGTIEAGRDQIPGSANDWNTVQNYAALRNDLSQLVLVSPEMPLMQFGGINTGRYEAGALPGDTHIFSWPMNNYWTTNFNAYQTGTHSWSYSMTSGNDHPDNFSDRFGWSIRVPFMTRILPGGGKGDKNWSGSVIQSWPENILLISAKPGTEKGTVLLHIREIEGEEVSFNLKNSEGTNLRITETDVLGHAKQSGSPTIMPFESKFFMVSGLVQK
ncbi:MAG: glycosyl hydrolase family 38 [Bacteroidetes bacterium]|nr:glycosyl hydrolase family 38 [Bacteroidota bacterium]